MPSLVQLEYALAVEKHRHFGAAAKACHVTQPTLSQQLQKLEQEVGLILFDRLKKPILPTPEGRVFLTQANAVLREQNKLLHLAKQTKSGGVSGDFRLAVIPTVASDLLPLFLKRFAKNYPRAQLFIEEMKTETILRELSADRLDGAILATPVEGEDFKVHPLYYEPFFLYLAAGHPLLRHSALTKEELDPSEMWLLQDGHCLKDQVVNFCARPGAPNAAHGNAHFQSGSLDTLKRLVERGSGYTMLPALMVHGLGKAERQAHVRRFKPPVPSREISLIYRRDHWKLALLDAIERTVAASLPDAIRQRPEKAMKVLEVPSSK